MKVIVNHRGSGEVKRMNLPYFAYHEEWPKAIWLLGEDAAIVVVGDDTGNNAGNSWYDYPHGRFVPLPANSILTLQNEVKKLLLRD